MKRLETVRSFLRRLPVLPALYRRLKQAATPARPPTAQDLHARAALADLERFFFTGSRLFFPRSEVPLVSAVIVAYNRAELTHLCLRGLLVNASIPLEVIVIDNASNDVTAELFRRVEGVRYVRNDENLHFLRGANQGAALARGEFLLFLNSDAELAEGALEAAVQRLRSCARAGAVVGRLILPDGSLQEAGSIVWRDGTCLGYGRGDRPDAPQYMFSRDVDYGSAAFLLTRRALFEALGGFDRDYEPAYYEDADYCLRLWENGWSVLYEPRASVRHFEFASQPRSGRALEMQGERRILFLRKRHDTISGQLGPASENILPARTHTRNPRRLLFLDECLPHRSYGAGYPRANEIVRAAHELGWEVTVYPAVHVEEGETWNSVYSDIEPDVEVMALPPYGPRGLERFLTERRGYYSTVFISRPTTMGKIRRAAGALLFGQRMTVYDAEALFTRRDELHARLTGSPLSAREVRRRIAAELSITKGVDAISTVSPGERQTLAEYGFHKVHVLSHSVTVRETTPAFAERSGMLFVGAIHNDHGPNADSMFWFLEHVFGILQKRCPGVTLTIAGLNRSEKLKSLLIEGTRCIGPMSDLTPAYDRARLFIAPTRFSAGIPLKVVEAAAHGVPVAATPLVASQLGWTDGRELLVGGDPESFARQCQTLLESETTWAAVRSSASQRVAAEYSRERLKVALDTLLAP